MSEQEKKVGFMEKLKAFFKKFSGGAKEFARKTAMRNSSDFSGMAGVLGYFEGGDHKGDLNIIGKTSAVLYALKMEDFVFYPKDVKSLEFLGQGKIYKINENKSSATENCILTFHDGTTANIALFTEKVAILKAFVEAGK